MRLNRNTVFLLVASLIVIAAALALLSSPASAPDNDISRADDGGPLFADIISADITQFSISAASAAADSDAVSQIVFERATAEGAETDSADQDATPAWTIADRELNGTIDASQIDAAISDFLELEYARRFGEETDALANFGLEAPAYTLSATTQTGDTLSLQLGTQNPSGTRYYALVDPIPAADTAANDDTVYLVTGVSSVNGITRLLDNPPVIAPPTPTPQPALNIPGPVFEGYSASSITRFTVQNNDTGAQTLLTRAPDTTEWAISEATNTQDAPTDAQGASILINGYGFLQATDALEDVALDPLGLDEPAFTLTATGQNGRTYRLQIGGTDASQTRYYALVDQFDTVAVVPRDEVDPLLDWIEQPPYAPQADAESTPEADATE